MVNTAGAVHWMGTRNSGFGIGTQVIPDQDTMEDGKE